MNYKRPDEGGNQTAGWKQRSVLLCRQGNFEQARELLEELERQGQMDSDACFMLATIHGQLARYDDALKYYERTLQISPNQFQAYIGQAKALVGLGRFQEAIEAYERAIAGQPKLVPVIMDLATLLLNLGRLEPAEGWHLRALELEPESEKVLAGLGKVYQAMRRPELAANYYQNAVRVKPDYADGHHMLGTLLFNQGRIDEAALHYSKALKIDATNITLLRDMGYLHLSMNRPSQARGMFQRALNLQPGNPDIIAALAKLDDQSGNLSSAYERIQPFIKQSVPHVEVGLVFADICRHFDRCHEAAEYLEGLLGNAPEHPAVKEKLYFALGKLYDRLGEYDRAFRYFEKGNCLKPDNFSLIEEAACIDQLIKVCDWNFFVTAPRSTRSTDSPIFIVGMPRSGTTLTEQILASHPDVHGLGEISVLPDIIHGLKTSLRTSAPYPESLKELTPDLLDALGNTYLDGIRSLGWAHTRRFTDKTLVNYLYLGLIALMFPRARVIHCVRDPRDTCLSIFFQSFDASHYYANRLENLGAYYTLYRRVMNHWKGLLNIPILELRYEDLIGDQEGKTRDLIEFAGLDWDDRVLRFYETKRSVVTASYDQVRQKIYTRSTARWKKYAEHIDPLVKAFGFSLGDSG